MIEDGIKYHLIRFINDPSVGSGTVCAIGDNWFYFGGELVENINSNELFDFFTENEIVDFVFNVFESLCKSENEEAIDEYQYYYSYLRNNLRLLGANEPENTDQIKKLKYHLKKYQYEKGYDNKSANGMLNVELTNRDIDTLLDVLNYAEKTKYASSETSKTLVVVVFIEDYSDDTYYDTYLVRITGDFNPDDLENNLVEFFDDDFHAGYTHEECISVTCDNIGLAYEILESKIPECDYNVVIHVFA